RGKSAERLEICRARAAEAGAWIVYVNAVGGQDELVFDGGSMVVSPAGEMVWHASVFDEDLLIVDIEVPADGGTQTVDWPVVAGIPSKPALPDQRRRPWPGDTEEV